MLKNAVSRCIYAIPDTTQNNRSIGRWIFFPFAVVNVRHCCGEYWMFIMYFKLTVFPTQGPSHPTEVTTTPTTSAATPTITPTSKIEMCENMTNTGNCPPEGCPGGQVCNGTDCVYMQDCPCIVDGQIIKVRWPCGRQLCISSENC